MDTLELLRLARAKFGEIFPCRNLPWEQCVTEENMGDRRLRILWFDTADGSTMAIVEEVRDGA